MYWKALQGSLLHCLFILYLTRKISSERRPRDLSSYKDCSFLIDVLESLIRFFVSYFIVFIVFILHPKFVLKEKEIKSKRLYPLNWID